MKECPICHGCLADEADVCPRDGAAAVTQFPGSRTLDGRYRLLRRLGSGGMGTVYEALHLELRRILAVKLLQPRYRNDERLLARFRHEAEHLARLRHPHIVEVYDGGVELRRSLPYLVMERLDGVTLAELLRRRGRLSEALVLGLGQQIAAALDHAHDRGVVHCDLKPANVFLLAAAKASPEWGRVKVLDFGLAELFHDPDATPLAPRPSQIGPASDARRRSLCRAPPRGTPGYAAPEQEGRQPVGPAADVYSFGILLYELWTGERPRARPPQASRYDGETSRPVAVIERALALEPPRRPSSAGRLMTDLRGAVRRCATLRWRRRERPRRLALASLAFLVPWLVAEFGALSEGGAESSAKGWLAAAERHLVDLRFGLAAAREPGPEVLLVLLDDESLAADPRPLTAKADELGSLLARALDRGASGAGINLLLPQSWSRSEPFLELLLRHAPRLVLAAYSSPGEAVVGPEAVAGLAAAALGPDTVRGLFGFVNLEADPDGKIRRVPARLRQVTGGSVPSFAVRAAALAGAPTQLTGAAEESFWLDGRIDPRRFERLSWKDLGWVVDHEAERLRGRLLLVGADFAGSAQAALRVPATHGRHAGVSAPELQALAIATWLAGRPVRSWPEWWRRCASGGVGVLAAALVLLAPRRGVAPAALLGAGWLTVAAVAFAVGGWMVPIAVPLCELALVIVLAFLARRLRRPNPADLERRSTDRLGRWRPLEHRA